MEQKTPFIRVLGSSNWCPTPGCDSSSYTVCDKLLIDTGWYAIPTLMNIGLEPINFPYVLFTHMHTDHMMALPQLLLYWRVHNHASLNELTLIGPKEMLRSTYEKAYDFAFHDNLDAEAPDYGCPKLIELSGGETLELAGLKVETTSSMHAVPGICYRVTDPATGHSAGLTGDTMYQEKYGSFFRGCDLLLHEASFGAGPIDPPESNAHCKHSSAVEAVRVATEAQVKHLVLTHAPLPNRMPALDRARSLLDIPVDWAEPQRVFEF